MGGQSDGQLNKINSQASLTEEKTDRGNETQMDR